jgi:hypothetical protein
MFKKVLVISPLCIELLYGIALILCSVAYIINADEIRR